MLHTLGPDTLLGYCTNVHAGVSLAETQANLATHAAAVKGHISPEAPMGIGLWLSAEAAREMLATNQVPAFKSFLDEQGLVVFTMNGFPYGDFHDTHVKHQVYLPDWRDPKRDAYTRDLITILAQLLPEDGEGSISTLPLGWRSAFAGEELDAEMCAEQLSRLVHHLARVELDTGKLIHIDIEPEPGCCLDTSADVVEFFQRHLLGGPDDLSVLAYLRVCHDICHAAVMGESQAAALAHYRSAGIKVGKVQVSSAIEVDFDALETPERLAAAETLRAFAEDRYLHQTTLTEPGHAPHLIDDLPIALDRFGSAPSGRWRVHFHVPLYVEGFGLLKTTQGEITACFDALRPEDGVHHFEAETYAWDVLPQAMQHATLAEGIAAELQWLRELTA